MVLNVENASEPIIAISESEFLLIQTLDATYNWIIE